jgi:hypothetical protein
VLLLLFGLAALLHLTEETCRWSSYCHYPGTMSLARHGQALLLLLLLCCCQNACQLAQDCQLDCCHCRLLLCCLLLPSAPLQHCLCAA